MHPQNMHAKNVKEHFRKIEKKEWTYIRDFEKLSKFTIVNSNVVDDFIKTWLNFVIENFFLL